MLSRFEPHDPAREAVGDVLGVRAGVLFCGLLPHPHYTL